MADIAIGKSCPRDGTLVACSGMFTDEQLTGQCPVCKQIVSMHNPSYVVPVMKEEPPPEPSAFIQPTRMMSPEEFEQNARLE